MPVSFSPELINEAHRTLIEQSRWSSRWGFERYHSALFNGVSFRNKRVLDVGGGIGTCSFLAALGGAADVLCLDPEGDGSSAGSTSRFQELARRLGIANARIEAHTVQTLQVPPRSFDVIILHNSINHVDEQACIDFEKSEAARAKYRVVFEKLADIATPGADLVIADCTSSNIFPMLGLKHPISQSIEWAKHQPPEVWARQLEKVGFEKPTIRWTAYSGLGALGWALTANRWAAFLLTGHFMLRMRRRE
jgi:SAM-dependent methyltransferase